MSTRLDHLSPLAAPRNPAELRAWIDLFLDASIPERPLTENTSAPLDYLQHAFFGPAPGQPRDCVVWAGRGGGKTFLGAIATALDLLFKPAIEVCILAGSREQAARMYDHLRAIFNRPSLAPLLHAPPTERGLTLENGSRCRLVAASHASIRGLRPQILRCDELELFKPDLWEAAQLVTRSKRCGQTLVEGAIEAFSTMHRPGGLMSRIVAEAADDPPARTLFRWGAIDILETCPPKRPCPTCPLEPDCRGRAKRAAGHLAIDDAITLKRRVSESAWNAEMLSLAPRRDDLVFPEFDRNLHVAPAAFDLQAPDALWCAAMDFGFRAPTVVLLAASLPGGHLHVERETSKRESLLAEHLEALADPPRPRFIAIDPAGRQRSEQTGVSNAAAIRRAGFPVRDRRVPFTAGLAAVRARLKPAHGSPTLTIHPRCRTLIESLERYHYPEDDPTSETPVKDGPDHAVDALRYLIVSLDRPYTTACARYA